MKDEDKTQERLISELAELRQRIAELEASEAERKQAEEALRESEERYRRLFEDSPISLWEEDFSEVKTYIDNLRASGVADFRTYFENHPEAVAHCADMVKVVDVNQATLELYKASSKEELMGGLGAVFTEKTYNTFREQLIAIAEGKIRLEFITTHQTAADEKIHITLRWSVAPGYEGTLSKVLVSIMDITEHKRAEEALRRRNRELELLNRSGQAFNSTLDLDRVLAAILEEVRRLLDVVSTSVWLFDPETNEMVYQQAAGSLNETIRGLGLRVPPGEEQGITGWVARHGESVIMPDTRADERYFKGVDQQTGLERRSFLSIPLKVKGKVIGVLNVGDTEVNRFDATDLTLVESLAATAAIAVDNARLYEQVRQDAATKSVLLQEVNHRVKNNLAAIIGLLYAERRHIGIEDQAIYQSIIKDLTNRVQSLATVHKLLSDSEWRPLLLNELTAQVIRSSLQMLPGRKRISVDVTPSPVRVPPNQAHELAVVINELATNTVKHALRERNTAHIAVRIALDDDTVRFEFRDDGPGYPEEVLRLERYNVGFELIQNVVRRGLRGELSLHSDHGAAAIIQFKVER